MKMKKIIFIVIILLSFTSCEKFLTEDPRGNLSADQYFNTKEECLTAINGVYFRFSNGTLSGSIIHSWNIGTDQFFTPRAVMFGGMVSGIFMATEYDGRILDYWTQAYMGVRDANMAINRINLSPLEDNEKNALLGEAKFLRALLYYYLVTCWGDVPFWTDELEMDVVSQLEKTSGNTILDNLLTDLDEAENYLPATTWGQNEGRPTKWAAKILKARIYQWQKDWAGSKTEASEVISQSPHRMLANYGDVFRSSNERNDELIFGVEYKEDAFSAEMPNQYRPQGNFESHITPAPVWFNGIGAWSLYQSFVDTYEPGDIRKKYTVIDSIDGKKTNFNWCLKYMEVPLPVDDPLMDIGSPMAKQNSGFDVIHMRLAEAFLILAESENELNGPTAVAYDAVDSIRNRAQLADLPAGLSQEELRQAIRDEYAKELVGEARGRKNDLVRWGILVETNTGLPARELIAQQNPILRPIYKTRANYYANLQATNVAEKWNYFPIPAGEIQRNPNLVQNPAWAK